jgi:hypothetical protein
MKQRNLARLAALGAVIGTAACTEPLTYPAPVPFQAELLPVSGSGITGVVSAISQGRNTTETAIGISGAQFSTRYAWRIHLGTCAAPGAVVGGAGSYPDFTTTARQTEEPDETASGSVVGAFLNVLLVRDTPYAAVVYGGANRDQVVACGPLDEYSV